MAIPLNSDQLLPQVQVKRCCRQNLCQKSGEGKSQDFSQNFSLILGEALFSRSVEDSGLTASVESLVLALLRQMHAYGPASGAINAMGPPVKTPYQAFPRIADNSLEPISESDVSKHCLQVTGECESESRPDLNELIQKASKVHNVDAELISAVIRAESNFDPTAASPKGAMGLMQLMPETARELGVEDPYDPEENIQGGVRYLKSLLDRYAGNVHDALAAYNWGMGNLERNPGRLPEETRGYIAKVLKYYQGTAV